METHLNNDNVHVSLRLGVTKIVETDRTYFVPTFELFGVRRQF